MNLKDKIDILLITYNREQELAKTLELLLAEDSPIKDFDIKIIDNNSYDNTEKVVAFFTEKYSNIKYKKNKYNLGLAGNITKAFYEAEKEYVWVLADNDYYCWDSWGEVENAIEKKMDGIIVSNFTFPKSDICGLFLQGTFTPGVIYKTSNITDEVMCNMTYAIHNLFPHMALFSYLLNQNKSIYVVENAIVSIGDNRNKKTGEYSFVRGFNNNDLHPLHKDMTWTAGIANTFYFIKDKKIRNFIVTHRYNGERITSIGKLFTTKNLYNTLSIFCLLCPYERFLYILKFLYYITFYKMFHIKYQYKRYEDMSCERKIRLKFLFFSMTLKKEILDFDKIGNKQFAYKNLYTKNNLSKLAQTLVAVERE